MWGEKHALITVGTLPSSVCGKQTHAILPLMLPMSLLCGHPSKGAVVASGAKETCMQDLQAQECLWCGRHTSPDTAQVKAHLPAGLQAMPAGCVCVSENRFSWMSLSQALPAHVKLRLSGQHQPRPWQGQAGLFAVGFSPVSQHWKAKPRQH